MAYLLDKRQPSPSGWVRQLEYRLTSGDIGFAVPNPGEARYDRG
jgi:hypothetical protein